MYTPAHLIIAAAAFAHPDKPKVSWAAIVGGLFPDISLYLMAAWSLFIIGNEPSYVFDVQYFSQEWQSVFAIDNSFFVWAAIIILGIILHKQWLWAFGGAGFLHLCFDFPLHHDDARQHFWPATDWIFESPFSYWDNNHHGATIGILEMALVVVLTAILVKRFYPSKLAGTFVSLALLQIAPWIIFGLMF